MIGGGLTAGAINVAAVQLMIPALPLSGRQTNRLFVLDAETEADVRRQQVLDDHVLRIRRTVVGHGQRVGDVVARNDGRPVRSW